MTAVSYDLCSPWATADDLGATDCCEGSLSDAPAMDDALAGASLILFNLTGQQWPGLCTDTIRPTAEHEPTLSPSLYAPYDGYRGPWGTGGRSYDYWPGMWGSCGCNRTTVCGLSSVSEIRLPGYPVASILSVTIDGATVSPSSYKIQDRQRLVYVPTPGDTRGGWPCCQMVDQPTTAANTWSVSYEWGSAPPAIGKRFAATLACQLYLSMHPNADGSSNGCRLPRRITSLTRQGVTIAVLDSFDVFAKGLTGIPEIDLWISADRMGRAGRSAEVITPGLVASLRRDQP